MVSTLMTADRYGELMSDLSFQGTVGKLHLPIPSAPRAPAAPELKRCSSSAMSCVRTESIEVFADYHQFYVQDGAVNPPAPEDWTEADVAHRAKAAANVVVVCPVRNMTVPVQVELHDVAPQLQDNAADHLVECSLALPSGHLQIHECTGGAVLNWQLKPGQYEVAILYSRLDSLSADGRFGDDHYQVLLWRGADRPLRVRQEWSAQ